MYTMEINKIVGAVLLALIVIKVSDIAGDVYGTPVPLAKPAYVEGGAPAAEAPAETAKAADKKPAQLAAIGPLLAGASADKGKSVARKCTTCHSIKKGGKAKVGPALWGIVGAKKAGGSFRYSSVLKGLGGTWDYEALNAFLADPRGYAPGNKMAFAGIKKAGDRAALILFLRGLSDSPAALP